MKVGPPSTAAFRAGWRPNRLTSVEQTALSFAPNGGRVEDSKINQETEMPTTASATGKQKEVFVLAREQPTTTA